MRLNPYEANHRNLLTDIKEEVNKWRCVMPGSQSAMEMPVLTKEMYHFAPS